MRSRAEVAEVIELHRGRGLGATEISRRTGIPRPTVKDWIAGRVPNHSRHVIEGGAPRPECSECGHESHDFSNLPKAYVYLLGVYLGDGCVSKGPRGVYRLRIFCDLKHPGIVEECAGAIRQVLPHNQVGRLKRDGSYADDGLPSNIEISAYSKALPCLFPQTGPGKKHQRRIWLAGWQQELAERWPEALLRGMIHSDGCRFTNTRGKSDSWSAPRYAFGNLSTDITSIFCTACETLGLRWTGAFPTDRSRAVTIYVSRRADVARMDEIIGPKR